LIAGQRYDIIVTANQASVASNFWMRAVPQSSCSANDNPDSILGIVYYGASPSTPTTTGYNFTDDCNDLTGLVPYLNVDAGSASYTENETLTLAPNSENLVRWYLNNVSMVVDWSDPTLLQIHDGVTNFTNTSAVITVPDANKWVYVIIQTELPVPHPIHLHGHDFYVLAQGTGTFSSSALGSLKNPTRRDTAMLPAAGYLVVAYLTNNPGAWLMHCHIGWHQASGLALQFIEQRDKIRPLTDYESLKSNCDAWDKWASQTQIVEIDSGI
jgi:FtsP/CotA-like multicopper oxidase with cupredoxin domain